MAIIISYSKAIFDDKIVILQLPEDPVTHMKVGMELATIGGVTYVSLPDEAVLPANQPTEISASIVNPVVITPELKSAIKEASPCCKLISKRMIETIRASYSIDDEMYFARIGVGYACGLYTPEAHEMIQMTEFGTFVEGVRAWGRTERAKLGL